MSTAKIIWTKKHDIEAVSFVYDVARKLALAGGKHWNAGEYAPNAGDSEGWFREVLSYLEGFKQAAAIEAAVRRIDGLATGRLVRSEAWCVRDAIVDELGRDEDYGEVFGGEAQARSICDQGAGQRLIRVRRIRKAAS